MSLISELITKNNLTGFPSIYPLIRSQIKEVGARGRCADLSLADQIKQIHSSPIQGEDRLPQQVRMDVIRKLDDFKLDHQDGHILLITSGLKTALKNSLESQSHPLQKLFNEIKVYSTREKIKEAEKNALVEYLKQVPTHLTQQPKLILEVVEQPNFQPENLKPHVENLKKQLDAMQAILDAASSEEVFSQLKEMYISILETPQNSADESSTAGNFDEVCFHLLVQPDGYSINGIIEHAGICIITQNGPCQIYKGSKCDQILFLYYNGKDHYQSISRNVYTASD